MSYIGLVAHCAALAVQHDLDKAKAIEAIEGAVDETQVELAQRWLDGGSPMKPYGMTDAEWEFWRRPEWTPEEIARIRTTRLSRVP